VLERRYRGADAGCNFTPAGEMIPHSERLTRRGLPTTDDAVRDSSEGLRCLSGQHRHPHICSNFVRIATRLEP